MPVTRRQADLKQGKEKDKSDGTTQTKVEEDDEVKVGDKRQVDNANELEGEVEPPTKKNKAEEDEEDDKSTVAFIRHTGTIERGHIYFFYRPRVEMEEAHSIDDVQRLHMLLVPRPPKFSVLDSEKPKLDRDDAKDDMAVLQEGADAVPAKATVDTFEKHYRLITIGKKVLPHPEGTSRRERVFWAAVTAVGDDLHLLEKGLRAKSYETKTRGTRHKEASRLAARGVYAIVNNEPSVPSKAETHLGFFISHPEKMGEVQEALGIQKASSFVLQVKNPLAPNTGGVRTPSSSKQVNYPESIMKSVFGQGTKGRESYGLRFVDCQTIELLEHEGAELLLIASRSGEEGVETSLGGGRGEALEQLEESEASESIGEVFRELALDQDEFPQDALKGEWIQCDKYTGKLANQLPRASGR